VAKLDNSGNLSVKGRVFLGSGQFMASGYWPNEDELFVCETHEDDDGHTLSVPFPQTTPPPEPPTAWWHPMTIMGSYESIPGFEYGVYFYCSKVITGKNITETINDYIEWTANETVKIAVNGRDVVAKFTHSAFGKPDFPGIWEIMGKVSQGNVKI